MTQANGFIAYQGPSLLDGSDIALIVVGLGRASKNAKTGGMVQTYILRTDMKPAEATRSGADVAICGDCKHRPANGGTCYVNIARGPTSVYKAFQRGAYMHADPAIIADMLEGRMLRMGTYGDPAAVPVQVWQTLARGAAGHTGYTHQWKQTDMLRDLVMASADSAEEMAEARAMGWRTFRVRTGSELIGARESSCPASEEAGKKLTCATCGMCNGNATGRKGSIAIIVHGVKFKKDRFNARSTVSQA